MSRIGPIGIRGCVVHDLRVSNLGGAGVAGLTLGNQLARAGVGRRASGTRTGSARMEATLADITGEGLVAAERMGLMERTAPTGGTAFRMCAGSMDAVTPIANVDVDAYGSSEGAGALKILRGDLEQALLDNLPSLGRSSIWVRREGRSHARGARRNDLASPVGR